MIDGLLSESVEVMAFYGMLPGLLGPVGQDYSDLSKSVLAQPGINTAATTNNNGALFLFIGLFFNSL